MVRHGHQDPRGRGREGQHFSPPSFFFFPPSFFYPVCFPISASPPFRSRRHQTALRAHFPREPTGAAEARPGDLRATPPFPSPPSLPLQGHRRPEHNGSRYKDGEKKVFFFFSLSLPPFLVPANSPGSEVGSKIIIFVFSLFPPLPPPPLFPSPRRSTPQREAKRNSRAAKILFFPFFLLSLPRPLAPTGRPREGGDPKQQRFVVRRAFFIPFSPNHVACG